MPIQNKKIKNWIDKFCEDVTEKPEVNASQKILYDRYDAKLKEMYSNINNVLPCIFVETETQNKKNSSTKIKEWSDVAEAARKIVQLKQKCNAVPMLDDKLSELNAEIADMMMPVNVSSPTCTQPSETHSPRF